MIEWFLGVIGGLIVLIKTLMLYIWVKHERKLDEVSTNQANLEKSLMMNYYDRKQIERYVDKELSSVQNSIDRLADVIVPLTLELRKLNEKVLVLETKEYLNDKFGGSS